MPDLIIQDLPSWWARLEQSVEQADTLGLATEMCTNILPVEQGARHPNKPNSMCPQLGVNENLGVGLATSVVTGDSSGQSEFESGRF